MYHNELESQIKSLKVVFDSIPEGVVIADSKKHNVLLMNNQAKKLFNLS
jgi:sensor histidine kinase regulating citrate/malate metabolism